MEVRSPRGTNFFTIQIKTMKIFLKIIALCVLGVAIGILGLAILSQSLQSVKSYYEWTQTEETDKVQVIQECACDCYRADTFYSSHFMELEELSSFINKLEGDKQIFLPYDILPNVDTTNDDLIIVVQTVDGEITRSGLFFIPKDWYGDDNSPYQVISAHISFALEDYVLEVGATENSSYSDGKEVVYF